MSPLDFRKIARAEPFRPFTIHYKTGKSYPIRRRDDAWIHPVNIDETWAHVADDEDGVAYIDTSWIVSISFDDVPQRKAG